MIFLLNLPFFIIRRRRQKWKERIRKTKEFASFLSFFHKKNKEETEGEKQMSKEQTPLSSISTFFFQWKKGRERSKFHCLPFLSFHFCLLLLMKNGRFKRKVMLNFSIIYSPSTVTCTIRVKLCYKSSTAANLKD